MKATKQAKRDATQLFRACLVKGVLDETRVREVLRQIAATKPRGYLDTLAYFRRLVQLDLDRHTAKIESATPLPAALQAEVKKDLEGLYGAGLQTFFVENPALIGGMRIKVGSDVYDGSIQARLAALERSF
jgi:F-type H+-transporting ATPase subunit delta